MNLTATAENGRARIELKGTISKWRETEAEFTSKVEELIKSGSRTCTSISTVRVVNASKLTRS